MSHEGVCVCLCVCKNANLHSVNHTQVKCRQAELIEKFTTKIPTHLLIIIISNLTETRRTFPRFTLSRGKYQYSTTPVTTGPPKSYTPGVLKPRPMGPWSTVRTAMLVLVSIQYGPSYN